MLIHSGNCKLIACKYCSAIFKRKTNLDDHVIRNHKEFIATVSSKIHQCERCSYKSTMSSHFARHVLKHLGIEPNDKLTKCMHCNATFKRKTSLDDHVMKQHPDFINTVSSKVHECKHCEYKTTNKTSLAKHLRKHPETKTTYKNSKCIYCNASFRSKTTLDDHIVKNHEEFISSVSSKIHHCEHCSYKTTMSTHFTKHKLKHPETGSSYKLSTCSHCKATFKSKSSLDDHVIKKHADFIASVSSKMHRCHHCSYKSTISSNFTRHMMNHPKSNKSNTCTYCNVTYKSKRALDHHMNATKFKPCIASLKT
nr:unnamed protein product [Callosobruchus chinensis]